MNDWVSQETLLIEGYRRCAKLTWRYGTTYFWGAALLPRPQRKHVYAVYALCRLADDIVDLPNGQHPLHPEPVEERESGGRLAQHTIPTTTSSTSPIRRSPSRMSLILAMIKKSLSPFASRPSPIRSRPAWPRAAAPIP